MTKSRNSNFAGQSHTFEEPQISATEASAQASEKCGCANSAEDMFLLSAERSGGSCAMTLAAKMSAFPFLPQAAQCKNLDESADILQIDWIRVRLRKEALRFKSDIVNFCAEKLCRYAVHLGINTMVAFRRGQHLEDQMSQV